MVWPRQALSKDSCQLTRQVLALAGRNTGAVFWLSWIMVWSYTVPPVCVTSLHRFLFHRWACVSRST